MKKTQFQNMLFFHNKNLQANMICGLLDERQQCMERTGHGNEFNLMHRRRNA